MAEFCLDCYNKLNGTNYREKDVTLDDELNSGSCELMIGVIIFY